MSVIASFILIGSLAFPPPILYALSPQQMKPLGQVGGAVKTFDRKDGIRWVEVTLVGTGGIHTAVTDYLGNYKIEVPPGVYRLKFRIEGCNPLHLAAFRLPAEEMVMPDVRFETCGIAEILGPNHQEHDKNLYDFREDSFNTPERGGGPSELLIRYAHRFEANDDKRYRGNLSYRGTFVLGDEWDESAKRWVERDKYFGVMVSYNGLLIYADTVNLDKKTLRLEAKGNVTLYKGSQGTKGQQVKVDFSARNPIKTMQVEQ